MGARTYEQVLAFGEWPYDDTPTYVFTRRELSPATDAVEFVDRGVTAVSTALRRRHDHPWLVGGRTPRAAVLCGARGRRTPPFARAGSLG